MPESHRLDSKDRETENRRLKKWQKMIQAKVWEKDMKTGKLRKRLFKGIPDAVRGAVWSKLLHIEKTRLEQKDKYEVDFPFNTCHIVLLLFRCHGYFINVFHCFNYLSSITILI